MKPIDLKNKTYINIGKEVNDKDPKYQKITYLDYIIILLLKAILQISLNKFL